MPDIKWIKVSTTMFDNRKIKQIEAMPEGDSILVIWIKLLCLAGSVNDNGCIYITPEVPYTEEMLATEFGRPLNTVKLALRTFQMFGMVEIIDDMLHLSSWEKYQNVDGMDKIREQTRKRVAKSRAKKQLESAPDKSKSDGCNATGNATVTHGNALEREREKEKDILSFSLSGDGESKQAYLGGDLGKGVVFMSDEQFDDLTQKLSQEELDHYISVVANTVLAGKRWGKSHYQAILDMATADRKVLKKGV